MSKLDTSWFKPENYSSLPELSMEGWYRQLLVRYNMSEVASNLNVEAESYEQQWAELTKKTDLLKRDGVLSMKKEEYNGESNWFSLLDDKLYPHSTKSVDSLPAIDIKQQLADGRYAHFHEAYEAWRDGKATNEQVKIAKISFDELKREAGVTEWGSFAHIIIDMGASNTQIESDFKKWLSSYRLSLDSEAPKNHVNQSTIDKWVRHGVLQYIDLKLVSKVEKKEITTKQLAVSIFPDEYEKDMTRTISDTTKIHAKRVLSQSFFRAFQIQLDEGPSWLDEGIEY